MLAGGATAADGAETGALLQPSGLAAGSWAIPTAASPPGGVFGREVRVQPRAGLASVPPAPS